MEYYQLGGFDAAIYSYKRDLGGKVFEPLRRYLRSREPGLELVLGIKRRGTSHLLLAQDEKNELLRKVHGLKPGGSRLRADDFESLSPILFLHSHELEAKLEALQPKPKATKDSSSLNKAYQDGGQLGVERGQFESCRVFYKVLQNQIIDRHKFDLGDTSWVSSMRVFSFCYNLWLLDARSREDRQRSPRVLDLGWCEASTPTLEGEMKSSQHVVFSNNQFLKNPDKKSKDNAPAERTRYEYSDPHGETQICDPQAVAQKVRDFFGQFTQSTRNPVVLLVYNKQNAIDVFKSLGVDVSKWDFGLKPLLRQMRAPRQAPNDPRSRHGDPRRRSASPRPHDRSRRRDSPPPPRQYAPVYVVDVKSMFKTVFGTEDHSESVSAIAERLELFQPQGWCAGNECWMLVEIFRQMAMRGAIDEQRKEWPDFRAQAAAANPAINEEEVSEYEGSDSD